MAAPGKQLLRCSTTYIPVGDLDRSPLIHSYGHASAGDRPTLFAIFSLSFVPFMQYAGLLIRLILTLKCDILPNFGFCRLNMTFRSYY